MLRCVCVCVCVPEYFLLHWSDMSLTITLVFMTCLCAFEGVSFVCVCVRMGMSKLVLYLGRLLGLGVEYHVTVLQASNTRRTDWQADRQTRSYKTPPLLHLALIEGFMCLLSFQGDGF